MVADSLAVRAQAFSGALVPLVLAVAFTLVQVLQHSTSVHIYGRPDPAAATLLPILHASLGTWMPYLQPGSIAAIVLTAAAVVGLGTAVPTAIVLRRSAVETVTLAA